MLLPRLQLVHDCWDLLNNQQEYYLPRGEREPDSAYKRRIDAALPSGFFRDALRTFAGMLTASHWRELPPSLQAVVSDVDGLGTDLGVFLERADLLVLRDGACLIAVTPPEHLWPSAGDYAQALRQGDRASLPKLQLIERADLLNWGHSPEGPSAATTLPTQLIYRSHGRPAGARSSGARPPLAQYVSVISGAAFVYWQYIEGCDRETYSHLENEARLKSLGLWAVPGGIQRPWDYRRGRKGSGIRVNRYICNEVESWAKAQELLKQGHSYLDRDGDGEACKSLR